jgi:prefoldin subunit 5
MNDELEAKLALLEEHIEKLNEQSRELYDRGWNAAIEHAAGQGYDELLMPFGADTMASFQVWLRKFKR